MKSKHRKNYPRLPPSKSKPRKFKAIPLTPVRTPGPIVVQPPKSYPRFSFDFIFKDAKGKRNKTVAFAYTTDLAEQQAKSLAHIWGYTFVKVVKRERLNWGNYYVKDSARAPKWLKRAVREYNDNE